MQAEEEAAQQDEVSRDHAFFLATFLTQAASLLSTLSSYVHQEAEDERNDADAGEDGYD